MMKGLYRFDKDGSPYVMVEEPKEFVGFVTHEAYVLNRYQPPYNERTPNGRSVQGDKKGEAVTKVVGHGSGVGHLIEQTGRETEVTYNFTVYQSAGIKSADGWMTTEDPTVFHQGSMAGHLTLQLADGRQCKVTVARGNGGRAHFAFSGPVPGF